MNRNHFLIAIMISITLLTAILTPMSSQPSGSYDPWLDYNEDGTIDVNDLSPLGQAYGSSGDPTKNVTVINFPLDDQGNLKVNVTAGIPAYSDSVMEAKSKVANLSAPALATVGIDIRPPPSEIWVMHYLCVEGVVTDANSRARIIIVDSITGQSITIEEIDGSMDVARASLNAEVEHKPICSNDVYYRLEYYNGLGTATHVYFAYVGKRVA